MNFFLKQFNSSLLHTDFQLDRRKYLLQLIKLITYLLFLTTTLLELLPTTLLELLL